MTKQPVRPYGENSRLDDILQVFRDVFGESVPDAFRLPRRVIWIHPVPGENQGEMIDAGYYIRPARQANPYANWRSPTLAHRGGSGTRTCGSGITQTKD